MRSPGSAFDLREALCEEVRGAIQALESGDGAKKAVHAARVRLKRARALARVGHAFAPGLAAVFNDSARAIMGSLAEARDLAALAKAARDLAKQSRKRAAKAFEAAREALEGARDLAAPTDYAAVHAGLRDLLALAQVWPEASPRQIGRGAQHVARRARKAWRKGHSKGAPEEKRHEWRQREKDRLYAAALLDEAWPHSRPPRQRANKKLVKTLGREHDLGLLAAKLGALPAPSGEESNTAAALRALARERKRLSSRARRIAARLHEGRA
jgi:hypothetical protein